jgi:GR25 family glycosyltransferase involved in LPS biosynthesis
MNFKETFPLQVFINLDKRTDRKGICIKDEFPKIGISPIRKSGVVVTDAPTKWWNGTLGCMLSHYQILQSALMLGTNVFIFEDDISFIGDDTKTQLDKACEELDLVDWDMFYISANILKPFYQKTKFLAKLNHAQSTVAYGVNKNFLEKLLFYIDLSRIEKPIDVIYADDVIPNNNCYITIPMLGVQRDSFSDIESKEVNYTSYLEKRYWDNIVEKD